MKPPCAKAVLAGMCFLVAEDNAFGRDALCEMLIAYGAQAVAARDGAQAVRLFAQSDEGTYDAAIMDVCMPVMDGYAAAAAIRRMHRRDAERMPIFAQSAASPQYAAQEAENCGMDACLQKPVRMHELARLLACANGMGQIERTV